MESKIEKYRQRQHELSSEFAEIDAELQKGADEADRVATIAENSREILHDLDTQFKEKTKLTDTDVAFLFLAIGLQITRQYLLTNDKFRVTDKQGDKIVSAALSLTPPSWQEILTQSVPYDAIKTGTHVSDTGLAGSTHRFRTLGHDPILGWIFGTANIITNSLTKTNMETYQVKNMRIIRHYPMGVSGMMDRAISYSEDDPKLLAAAVARQAIHYGSDFFTKQGLPVPFIATVNNGLAQKMLSKWHIDMWSITRGAALAAFINQLIALIHGLFCDTDDEMERRLYEVRTRKILSYSNLVATSSNLAVVAITEDMKKLDIGGFAVTVYRLITDAKFIRQVKEEFVFGQFQKMILGDDFETYSSADQLSN